MDVDNYILLRKYKVNNLTKYELIGGKGDVVVPPFYEKVIIDKISGFSGKQLKSIVIPSTINELPKSAFASCKELEKVQGDRRKKLIKYEKKNGHLPGEVYEKSI